MMVHETAGLALSRQPWPGRCFSDEHFKLRTPGELSTGS